MIRPNQLKWYHATRSLGAITVLYELFFATGTAERGTIILAGFAAAGFDLVARHDGPSQRGQRGKTGKTGDKGDKGDQGERGHTGERGERGDASGA